MNSRKREREEEPGASLNQGGGEEASEEVQHGAVHATNTSVSTPQQQQQHHHHHRQRQQDVSSAYQGNNNNNSSDNTNSTASDERVAPFPVLLWNEVSTVLFARVADLIRTCLLTIIRLWEMNGSTSEERTELPSECPERAIPSRTATSSHPTGPADRNLLLHQLHQDLRLTWEAGKSLYLFSSPAADVTRYDTIVVDGLQQMVHQLLHVSTVQDDPLTLCKQFIRVTEEYGLAEEDGGELGACLSMLKFKLYPNGYAYSERLPVVVVPPVVPVPAVSQAAGPATATAVVGSPALPSPTSPVIPRRDAGGTKRAAGPGPSSSTTTPGGPTAPAQRHGSPSARGGGSGAQSTSPTPPAGSGPASSASPVVAGRRGYVISLQQDCPNLSPLLNTTIQLMEPRKRRPPLDEYRIFSHPKKTTTHGVEDIIVDEELYYRSLCLLSHHLDTFGSLHGLSPFARFCLYNVVERVDKNFFAICDRACTSHDVHQQLVQLRDTLEAKKESLEKTRASLREAAQQIGWFAVSAQWRDQVLGTLQDVEENDWYCLSDTLRTAGISRFPNYITSSHVKAFVWKVLEKLTAKSVSTAAILAASGITNLNDNIEDPFPGSKVQSAVKCLLFPMLEGRRLTWPPPSPPPTGPIDESEPSESSISSSTAAAMKALEDEELWRTKRARVQRKLRHLYVKWSIACKEGGQSQKDQEREAQARDIIRGNVAVSPFSVVLQPDSDVASTTLMIPSLLFPIQCLGELLEVCSCALSAGDGIDAFAKTFLSTEWGGAGGASAEEAILRHLLREEPTNISIAPLVAIPKIYKDLVAGLQVLFADITALRLVVEAKNVMMDMENVVAVASSAATRATRFMTPMPSSLGAAPSRCCRPQDRWYVYWKMFSTFLEEEEERMDELVFFTTGTGMREAVGYGTECLKESPATTRCYSEAAVERATRVWPQEMVALLREEEKHREGKAERAGEQR